MSIIILVKSSKLTAVGLIYAVSMKLEKFLYPASFRVCIISAEFGLIANLQGTCLSTIRPLKAASESNLGKAESRM